MAFDKAVPATSTPVKTGWPQLLANQTALETAVDKDHDFTTGGGQSGDHQRITMPEVSEEAGEASHATWWNESGVIKFRYGTGTVRILSADGDVIPAATKMWFYADTAPTGWTIDATPSDELLAVKGGSTYATGGAQAGTWSQPNHTHTTGDVTLSISEMPAHTHDNIRQAVSDSGGTSSVAAAVAPNDADTLTNSTGGDTAHNHGATGNGATANTWRPSARVGIICSKDAY